MASAQLSATPRAAVGKGVARTLRRAGQVPAVIYGHAREPQPLAIGTRELERLLERHAAESTVIELDIAGSVARTLIREIQRHPFKRDILHVDFQELVAGEKVTVSVPLVLVGTPEGVRLGGGILNQVMSELAILVDPSSIPNRIEVDISELTIGHSLHVSDLVVPEGVEIAADADDTVVVLAPPKTAAEAEETVAADTSAEPELIRKAKVEGEGEDEK